MKAALWRVNVKVATVRGDTARIPFEKEYEVSAQLAFTAAGRCIRKVQRDYKRRLTRNTTVYFNVRSIKR